MKSLRKIATSTTTSGKKKGGDSEKAQNEDTARPPPITTAPVPAFEFPAEDEASSRERFEKLVSAPPMVAFTEFYNFVWRENANIGLASWLEIIKDSTNEKKTLEKGMQRRVGGYDEEVTLVEPGKMIEYHVLEDAEKKGPVSSNNKGRITFKPSKEDANKTVIVWTIFWSPNSITESMLYKIMIKTYCNLALFQLERKLVNGSADRVGNEFEEPKTPTNSSGNSNLTADALDNFVPLKDGEVPTLQWAARLQTGYEGNLTEQQAKSLEALREKCKANGTYDTLVVKHPDGADRVMLRFLRAECGGRNRDFNVEKSYVRLIDTLKWRQEIGCDEKFLKGVDPPDYEKFRNVGNELELVDKEGRIVVFTRAGILSTHMDTKIMPEEHWKLGLACVTERRMQILRDSSKRLGHEVSASIVIYDLKGVGFASRKIIPFTKIINEVASKHYPEMVDIIFLINAPAIFSSIWALVKTFIDPVTESKVKVFGHGTKHLEKFHTLMRQLIDENILPKELGGKSDVVPPYVSSA